ncbi:MAG: hypothetical protein ACXWR1_03425, partial [Bdellovibrionota bacterium]
EAYQKGVAAGALFGRSKLLGFARSSGSYGESKNLPLNQAYMRSLERSLARMVACQLFTTGDWKVLLSGRQITLGSRPSAGTSPTNLPVSDISGLLPTLTWRTLRHFYIPKHSDLWIEDWETKIGKILQQAHGQDVHTISGIPALLADFARRSCEKFNVRNLNQLWPNLRHVVYGGENLSAERKQEFTGRWFEQGHKISYSETYFATEGPLGFSYNPGEEGLALNSLENLYLFGGERGEMLFTHEVQPGARYSLYVTTPGGLVNYRMFDRVEVVSHRPLRVRVVGREKDEISMTGEKITLAQLDLALQASGLGAGTYPAVVWIEHGVTPYLAWGVCESLGPPQSEWASRLDEKLAAVNTLYAEALYVEKVVGPSRVIAIPSTVFEEKIRQHLGLAQFKPKRIFSSRADLAAAYPALNLSGISGR